MKIHKLIALLLAMVMIIGMIPTAAATETTPTETTTVATATSGTDSTQTGTGTQNTNTETGTDTTKTETTTDGTGTDTTKTETTTDGTGTDTTKTETTTDGTGADTTKTETTTDGTGTDTTKTETTTDGTGTETTKTETTTDGTGTDTTKTETTTDGTGTDNTKTETSTDGTGTETTKTETSTDGTGTQDTTTEDAEIVEDEPESEEIEKVFPDSNGVTVTVKAPKGAFSAGTKVEVKSVDEATITAITDALTEQEAEYSFGPIAYDITFYDENGEEVQPNDGYDVEVSFDVGNAVSGEVTDLNVYHMAEIVEEEPVATFSTFSLMRSAAPLAVAAEEEEEETVTYEAQLVTSASGTDKVKFDANSFSIYVVTGNTSNDWNRNNWKIVMSVGDTLELATSTTGSNYKWTVSNTSAFSLSSTSESTPTITANSVGTATVTVTYSVTTQNGNGGWPSWGGGGGGSTTTNYEDTIEVVALAPEGDSISNDIIFANITASHESNDTTSITEYGNTYGPYVMKIRFEDTDGNLLAMNGAQDYYVFDSAVSINLNTFAAIAPEGYTYSGSFFYWSGHYSGQKSYVSEVTRLPNVGNYGSNLYFDWIVSGGTNITENDHYQPSGVLHIVYAKSDESYSVVFKDHDDFMLQSYVVLHSDSGNKIPEAYVMTLEDTLLAGIENNHGTSGYEFTGKWEVTGGGNGINGTYTTDELISEITTWNIESNITIKAVCEASVTINYVAVTKDIGISTIGGSVDPTFEQINVSATAAGSTPDAEDGYEFVGWFKDEACQEAVDATWVDATTKKINPQKVNGVNVAATYYALFERSVGDMKITKIVDKAYTGDTLPNDSFEFTVDVYGDANGSDTYSYTIYNDADDTAVENGTGTITDGGKLYLKGGQYALIEDVPVGEFTVTETEDTDYTTTVDGEETREATGNVDGVNVPNVEFTNIYTKHVGDLKIVKTGVSDANAFFVFNVSGGDVNMDVVVYGNNGTATIKDLPIDVEYTVNEVSGYWRYDLDVETYSPSNSVTLTADGATITVTNKRTEDKWLDDFAKVTNKFDGKSSSTGSASTAS